jgi:hypothetical protein
MLDGLGVNIAPASELDTSLPRQTGLEFAAFIARLLIRYLRNHQVGLLTSGSSRPQWVTLTPYSGPETISWLALPVPRDAPTHALLLNPARMGSYPIDGPRWVRLGGGVEFLLPMGFPSAAISPPGWELELR